MKVGQTAITVAYCNLRELPNGTIVSVVPHFSVLNVIDGPSNSDDGLIWWKVDAGYKGWICQENHSYTPLLVEYHTDDFSRSMYFVLNQEGGESDFDHDAGGYTRYGIAQKMNPQTNVHRLKLSDAWVIYKEKYWNAGAHELKWPLSCCYFDKIGRAHV